MSYKTYTLKDNIKLGNFIQLTNLKAKNIEAGEITREENYYVSSSRILCTCIFNQNQW